LSILDCPFLIVHSWLSILDCPFLIVHSCDRALSMTVSKHVTLYGPRPCLQYYNMTTSHPSATRGQAEQLCVFVP
jgi:hypothetical protein